MEHDGYLLLAYSRCNRPDQQAAWSAWYDDEHLPALLECGASVATRFALTQQPVPGMPSVGFSHISIVEFRGVDAEARVDATLELERRLATDSATHPNHCLMDVDVLIAHGSAGRKSEPAPDLEGHILAYVMPNQPARHVEWDAWYDEVHLPDMMSSGAFRAGSRWRRREPRPFGANDLTLYDVAGKTIEEAVEQSAAIMPGLQARGRKLDCHVGGLSFTVRATGR